MCVHLFVKLILKQMLEKKKDYINQLLTELKNLEERVQSIKNEEALPFSFFREAFDKTQIITRTLHELELLQIDDMKHQMEKLVLFLSESGNQPATHKEEAKLVEIAQEEHTEEVPETFVPEIIEEEIFDEEVPVIEEPAKPRYNAYAEGIILPEYKDPRTVEKQEILPPEPPVVEIEKEETPVIRSFNDTIQAPPAVLDLKRGLSLNDRFLFQRELFNNDRHEMNSMMIRLNAFNTYPDVENYLRENTSWNFDNQMVKDFLLAIKKGFE